MNIKLYECTFCKKKFDNQERLKMHANSFSLEWKEKCKVCNLIVPLCTSMEKHVSNHPYCNLCKKYFLVQKTLAVHRLTEHLSNVPHRLFEKYGLNNFVCYICGQIWKEPALADIHVKVMHPVLRLLFNKNKRFI